MNASTESKLVETMGAVKIYMEHDRQWKQDFHDHVLPTLVTRNHCDQVQATLRARTAAATAEELGDQLKAKLVNENESASRWWKWRWGIISALIVSVFMFFLGLFASGHVTVG